jgi:hypothetical protein
MTSASSRICVNVLAVTCVSYPMAYSTVFRTERRNMCQNDLNTSWCIPLDWKYTNDVYAFVPAQAAAWFPIRSMQFRLQIFQTDHSSLIFQECFNDLGIFQDVHVTRQSDKHLGSNRICSGRLESKLSAQHQGIQSMQGNGTSRWKDMRCGTMIGQTKAGHPR